MKFRNFKKNTKAISPVIATLLMIAVAVVASLVAYAWVMGYIGFQTEKTGNAIQVQSMTIGATNPRAITVYVQNIGDSSIQFSTNLAVYVNGTMVPAASVSVSGPNTTTGMLAEGATATVSIATSANLQLASGSQATIKVVLQDGTPAEIKQTVP